MKKSTKVTISLVIVIVSIAVAGIIYRENYFNSKTVVGTTQEQQVEELDVQIPMNSNEISTNNCWNGFSRYG